MVRRRFGGVMSPLPVDDGKFMAQIPRLPFLEGQATPPCSELGTLFEYAGDDSRIDNGERQRAVIASERGAKSVCRACPVELDCRAYAIATRQQWGVWGGTNTHERQEYMRVHGRVTWEEVEAMGPEELRRKFEQVPTIELFSPAAYERRNTGDRERQKTRRAIAYGNCPGCTKQPAPVIVVGQHWVWRTHMFRTWGNETRQCRASNVALCVAPEPDGKAYNGTPLACPHGPDDDHASAA